MEYIEDNNKEIDAVTNNDVEILQEVENTNTNWESFFKNNPSNYVLFML